MVGILGTKESQASSLGQNLYLIVATIIVCIIYCFLRFMHWYIVYTKESSYRGNTNLLNSLLVLLFDVSIF